MLVYHDATITGLYSQNEEEQSNLLNLIRF